MGSRRAYDLGILLLPGYSTGRSEVQLRRFGDALLEEFVDDRPAWHGLMAVEDTILDPQADEPAQLTISFRSSAERTGRRPDSWLVAASPLRSPLDDDDLQGFLFWLLRMVPWFTVDFFDRQAMHARRPVGAPILRWRRSIPTGLGRWASLPLLLFVSMVLAVLLLLVSVPVPGVRGVSRAGARRLMDLVGPTYAHTISPTAFDAAVGRALGDLDWLTQRCRRVAIVAISQQVPVALELVRQQEPGTIELLVTAGSTLRKLQLARWLRRQRGADALAVASALGYVGFSVIAWTVLVIYLLQGLLLILSGAPVPAAVVVVVLAAGLFAGIRAFARRQAHEAHADLVRARKAARLDDAELLAVGSRVRWIDLAASADPIPEGPMFEGRGPSGWRHVEITGRASPWSDHRHYLRPHRMALSRILFELTRVAGLPAGLPDPGTLQQEALEHRWRVRWLVRVRWVAVVAGLLGALAVTSPLRHLLTGQLSPTEAEVAQLVLGPALAVRLLFSQAVVTFLVISAAWAAVSYLPLKACWWAWDTGERRRRREPPVDQPGRHFYSILLVGLSTMILSVSALAASGCLGPSVMAIANAVSRLVPEPQARGPALVLVLLVLLLLPLILLEPPARFVLRRPALEHWLERRSIRSDAVHGAELALQGLPAGGVVLRGSRYWVAPITWTIGSKHRRTFRSPRAALTLLRDDAVLLDVREGCWQEGKFVRVQGDAVYVEVTPTGDPPGDTARLRFARARDWRTFTQDLPQILRGLP